MKALGLIVLISALMSTLSAQTTEPSQESAAACIEIGGNDWGAFAS